MFFDAWECHGTCGSGFVTKFLSSSEIFHFEAGFGGSHSGFISIFYHENVGHRVSFATHFADLNFDIGR